MGRLGKQVEDYNELAEEKNLTWLGITIPKNTLYKTTWRCKKGHTNEASYNRINQGKGCYFCHRKGVRLKTSDYYKLAKKRGFTWLGVELPRNSVTKTTWKCSIGHIWEVTYNSLKQGTNCNKCSPSKPKKKIEDYKQLATEKGFTWVGDFIPESTVVKTFWLCGAGHKWEVSYNRVLQNTTCNKCFRDKRKKSAEDYGELAKEKGFTWLGVGVPEKTRIKTTWRCGIGHIWDNSYTEIRAGKGCYVCYKEQYYKKSEDYHKLAKKRGFTWLGPSVKKTSINTKWECKNKHTWEAGYNNILQGTNCPLCLGRKKKTSKDYKNLAKTRGFTWVGGYLPKNTSTKTQWSCENKHTWETAYSNINQGTNCPFCSNKRKCPLDYHNLAESRGFKWKESLVKNTATPMMWECVRGHLWETTYTNMQQGRKCPQCYPTKKLAEDYQLLGEAKGFTWKGEFLPKNTTLKTTWQCSVGHTWEAKYNNIHNGYGCPECYRNKRKTFGAGVKKPKKTKPKQKLNTVSKPKKKITVEVKRGIKTKKDFRAILKQRLAERAAKKDVELEIQKEGLSN